MRFLSFQKGGSEEDVTLDFGDAFMTRPVLQYVEGG